MIRLLVAMLFGLYSTCLLGSQNNVNSWVSNGVDVWFVSKRDLPMLEISLVFDAGSLREGSAKGLAKLTNNMLFTGCGSKSELEIASDFEDIGAEYSAKVNQDYASLRLKVLSDQAYLQQAISTFNLCLKHPVFSSSALNKVRSLLSASWLENQKKPKHLALSYLKQQFYPNHPYGRYPNVAPKIMAKNTISDISKFYFAHYNNGNAHLIIVGDLSLSMAKALANKITANLPKGQVLPALIAPKIMPAKDIVLHLPNQAQDTTIVAFPGVSVNDRGAILAKLANYPFGSGELVSRLMHQLRDSNGYTYAVFGVMAQRRLAGEYYIVFQSRPGVSKQASDLAKDSFIDFVNKGATDSELHDAKKSILQEIAERKVSTSGINSYLSEIAGLGLGLSYYNNLSNLIDGANLSQVNYEFNKLFSGVKSATVVVKNG